MDAPAVAPSRDDPVVAGLSAGIGGPAGRRAGRGRFSPVGWLLLLTAVVFSLGMVQKAGCWATGWSDSTTRYQQMCYSDLPYLYTGRGFGELAWPYSDDPQLRERYQVMEYPVGIAYWAYGAAWLTQLVSGPVDLDERAAASVDDQWGIASANGEITRFVAVNAVGLALLTLLATWFLARTHRRRPWDAAAFALSPALLLTGLVNWDLLAVALVAAAVWAWARDRALLAGVLVGLGTATKLYPLFLLGGVLIIAVRERRWRDLALAIAGGAGAWVLADLPAYLSGPEEWKVFWSFNSDRAADLGSLWLLAQQTTGHAFGAHAINVWSWLLFGAWCLGVLCLGLRAPRVAGRPSPRLAQLGFLVVAGFLIVNKVYSPQYVLWLLPLAALARPRWRDQLVWQATEVFYFAAVWWYLGGFLAAGAGEQAPVYWIAIAMRVAGELYLVAVVVRDVLRPANDPVVESPVAEPVGARGWTVSR